MKLIFYIVVLYSYFSEVILYPFDKNETAIEETDEALNDLQLLIFQTNFASLLENFQHRVSESTTNVHKKISDVYSTYSQSLLELENNAKNINVDTNECMATNSNPDVEEFYKSYEDDCQEVINAVGQNIVSAGSNRQLMVFAKEYEKIARDYQNCVTPDDPYPMICEGVVASTLQQVRSFSKTVQSHSLEVERQLKQELLNLSQCADRKVTDYSRRSQNEFTKIMQCVLSITVAF
ncbi:hypothetical protein NQ318_020820 [Aromia moschata]|uniref:Uncharacterized protein n=1 Tax=Aromia moschata TaxID=1265417 RepID=A0AAV8Y7C5_9CUCU|nr:hypothetical protein NQ318_020820 [Aromia moschata]